MNKEKVISNTAVIVLSVVLAAWLPVSGSEKTANLDTTGSFIFTKYLKF